MLKCLLLRGLPGSGKTTLADRLRDANIGARIHSADNYFVNDGVYKYDKDQQGAAHIYCQNGFYSSLLNEAPLVIVHNTLIQAADLAFYYELASSIFEYDTEIITLQCTPEESLARNVHNVPEKTIRNMAKSLEYAQLPKRWKHRKFTHPDAFRWSDDQTG